MRIAVPAETDHNEGRVAATPETVKKFIGLGASITVQKNAGLASGITDADYQAAGASIADDAAGTLKDAAIVLRVRRPGECRDRRIANGRARHRNDGPLRP